MLQDKPMVARQTRLTQYTTTDDASKAALSDFEDDFDLSAYQSKMNSDIVKQATQDLKGKEEPAAKIILLLYAHKKGKEQLPANWETPIGLKVLSTVTFNKVGEEFLKNKRWSGGIVLAWKGVKVVHGTPKDLGLADQSKLGKIPKTRRSLCRCIY